MKISFSNSGLLAFLLRPVKSNSLKTLLIILIVWLPIVVGAFLMKREHTTLSIVNDFEFHIRFLLLIPLIILMEKKVDQPFNDFLIQTKGIILNDEANRFQKVINNIAYITKYNVAELLYFALFYSLLFLYWEDVVTTSNKEYFFDIGTKDLNSIGWYYLLVSLPFFQLLIFRWVFRWVIWVWMLYRVSTLKLNIDPVHADGMGGLEYINLIPFLFSFLSFLISSIIATHMGSDIVFGAEKLKALSIQIIFFTIFFPLLNYLPLLFFVRKMFKAKTEGILMFGRLIREHNTDYFSKWIYKRDDKDILLGSVDNSSLADINGSYAMNQSLRLFPINSNFFLITVVVSAFPYFPLLLTQYSIIDLFKQLVVHFIS
ncbi:hypothetical protein [Flammeovirga sp. SubArs3]|uniref:hypothetical protein n=1 Tax=Flammeovirga sp. SubArs3 TaxID=2995316 RepID=UPI00248A9A63|nr:hypothetical protein [Flammeovirga sp. SubArs3]